MDKEKNVKLITKTWLYSKTKYTTVMINAINEADRIDKNTDEFLEDVSLAVKRSSSPNYLLKILNSKNVILLTPKEPLPKPIRVFCAKDIKNKGSDIKVFIDVTDVIEQNENTMRYKVDVNRLIAYLVSAKINMIYYKIPGAFIKNAQYTYLATKIYAKLFTHIVDYLGNISVIPENKNKMMYYASKYFLFNVMGMTNEERVAEIAIKASDITTSQANIYDLADRGIIPGCEFKDMLSLIQEQFKMDKLTASLFVSKWMYLYGSGTMFGIEFFPAYVQMITDAYIGIYSNNQKTIEKVAGKDMVEFGKLNIYNNNGIM